MIDQMTRDGEEEKLFIHVLYFYSCWSILQELLLLL